MKTSIHRLLPLILIAGHASILLAAPGQTTVAKWKGDRQGALSMNIDDGMTAHRTIAVPELAKRGLVGTFFICPGWWGGSSEFWEKTAPGLGQELANHSWTHDGAADYAAAVDEIGQTARFIWSTQPAGSSRLMAFNRGGGTTWNVTEQQMSQILSTYHSIDRRNDEDFFVASEGTGTASHMISIAQAAMNQGSWRRVVIHGIGPAGGGNWMPIDTEPFLAFLDFLAASRDRLWVDGYIAVHKYIEERTSARVTLLSATPQQIRIDLSDDLTDSLFDAPLTLVTEVWPEWTQGLVAQGGDTTLVEVSEGHLMYEAVPDRGTITIMPPVSTANRAAPWNASQLVPAAGVRLIAPFGSHPSDRFPKETSGMFNLLGRARRFPDGGLKDQAVQILIKP